jgi:hypothetical protein
MEHQKRRIEVAFTPNREVNPEQVDRIETIQLNLKALAHSLTVVCPYGRELNSCLKTLEEAQAWAMAAIIRNE